VLSAVLLVLAVSSALVGPAARLLSLHLSPLAECVVYGLAVVGAAAVLAWATEVAQLDLSRALAFSVLALIAVLPEYAVDMYFAYSAATQPEYTAYAAANMTGANRLLVGVGWPLVVLLAVLTARRWVPAAAHDVVEAQAGLPVRLPPDARLDNGALGLATAYSFVLPLKGNISLLDMAVLVGLFAVYAWRVARAERTEPEMIGPAALIARLPRAVRRLVTLALFLVAAASIFLVAEPFAEALIEAGAVLGIDRFLLVQWLAPLASEAPELIVVSLLAVKGEAGLGLAALLASRLNQWTLLVGMLPLAYSVGAGAPRALPLDAQQAEEVLLTAAQSLLAFAVLLDLRLTGRDALLLFALFLVQFVVPGLRIAVTVVCLALAVVWLVINRKHLRAYFPRWARLAAGGHDDRAAR
jgi:cation:H+ antiporter